MSLVLTREALSNQIADDLATRNTNAGLIEGAVDGAVVRIDTLNADDATEGSVAKSIKDNAENATFTPAVGSGITSVKVVEAVNEVGSRVTAIENSYNINSWFDLQKIVRLGKARKYLSVGDQFLAEYNIAPTIFNVIGIDHPGLVPTDPRFTHTLALQPQDCLMDAQFSAPQAIFGALTELSAGTHIFTLNSVKYQVTTTQPIPVGGVMVGATWGGEYVPLTITTYGAGRVTPIESSLPVTTATGADTITVNDHTRSRYGSNRYIHSALKQWINSNDTTFVWVPKGQYDMPSSYETSGFLKLLDPELVAVLGSVTNKVAKVTYDGGVQDSFVDKVFLLSQVELGYGSEGVTTGESVYEFYDGVTDAERIKLLSGSPRHWWLRSPNVGGTRITRTVHTSGMLGNSIAYDAFGLAPACVIW